MNLVQIQSNNNEKIELIVGEIVRISPGNGSSKDRLIDIDIKGNIPSENGFTPKIINMKFWDSENNDKRQLRSRFKASKAKVGSIISILTVLNEDNETRSALDFKFSGVWTFKEFEDKPEKNIIIGNISFLSFYENRISLTVNAAKERRSVCIWKSEKSTLYKNAALYLEENKYICLVCGPEKDFETMSGTVKKCYNAKQFYIM